MAINNYVKFIRGTPAAYARLPIKDEDTLYFISANDDKMGRLYLGSKLIAGSIGSDTSSIINSLYDLKDVQLDGVKDGQFLGFDPKTEKWIPMDVSTSIKISVMVGATEEQAGLSGLVPAPAAGDQNKFLRGDGTWFSIDDDLNKKVDQTYHIVDGQKVPDTLLSPEDKKKLDILTFDNDQLTISAKIEAEKVENLASWITEHRDTVEGLVSTAQEDKLKSVETGAQVNIINAVDSSSFTITEGKVLNLNEIPMEKVQGLSQLNTTVDNLQTQYINLDQRLTWEEIVEN